MIEKDICR